MRPSLVLPLRPVDEDALDGTPRHRGEDANGGRHEFKATGRAAKAAENQASAHPAVEHLVTMSRCAAVMSASSAATSSASPGLIFT